MTGNISAFDMLLTCAAISEIAQWTLASPLIKLFLDAIKRIGFRVYLKGTKSGNDVSSACAWLVYATSLSVNTTDLHVTTCGGPAYTG